MNEIDPHAVARIKTCLIEFRDLALSKQKWVRKKRTYIRFRSNWQGKIKPKLKRVK